MGSDRQRRLRAHRRKISIHAPRMGSDEKSPAGGQRVGISIHAPRMGSDGGRILGHGFPVGISIHAPRMGSDCGAGGSRSLTLRFQSTLPGWGATGRPGAYRDIPGFQSTLPGWGATAERRRLAGGLLISIHAPRMGSDRENGHLRPRYGQNHPFSTLIVSQIVVDVLGTVRKSQKTPAH